MNRIYLYLCFLIISCDNQKDKWNVYNSSETQLKSRDESFIKILSGGKELYMLGNIEETIKWTDNKHIIYKSVNKGKKWDKILTGDGSIVDGFIVDGKILFLKENYIENSFRNSKLSLYQLELKSGQLSKVHDFKSESSFVSGDMYVGGKGFILLKNGFTDNTYSFLKTENGFYNFDSLSIKQSINKFKYDKMNFYASSYASHYLFKMNDNLKMQDSISLGMGIKIVDFSFADNGDLVLLCKEKEKVKLKVLRNKKAIKEIILWNKKHILPKMIYVYEDFIAVLMSEKKSMFATNHLFISIDKGDTFQEEKITIDDYISPIYFHRDEYVIIYSGAGRISYLDLKK